MNIYFDNAPFVADYRIYSFKHKASVPSDLEYNKAWHQDRDLKELEKELISHSDSLGIEKDRPLHQKIEEIIKKFKAKCMERYVRKEPPYPFPIKCTGNDIYRVYRVALENYNEELRKFKENQNGN